MKLPIRWGLFAAVCLALLQACSRPSNADVKHDVAEALRADVGGATSVELLSVEVGEGDADSVYFVVDVQLTTEEDKTVAAGALVGLNLKRGQPTELMGLNVLYQTTSTGRWTFSGYTR